MTDAWRSVKIREFERVIAGPSITLLRLAGKAPRWRHVPRARPTLVSDNGLVVRRFAAIPSPADARGILHAAYWVASELVTPETVFSLELADGFVIALPSPTPGAARRMQPPEAGEQTPSPPGLETEALPARADDRRSDMIEKLAEQSAALARLEQEVSDGEAARAESQADAERARLRARELEDRVTELVAETAEAAARLSKAEARIAEADAWIAEAEADAGRLADEAAAQAADARAQIESLELTNLALKDSIAERQEKIAMLERAADDARESRTELENEIVAERAASNRVRHELAQAVDSARMMASERDELKRQAAAFDVVATKARERAMHAEDAHEESSATLRELQIWRAEIERRLAATTTELAEARAAHQNDAREVKRLRGELAEAEARAELGQVQIDSLHERLSAREDAAAAPGDPDPAEVELLRQVAEAEARKQAERELADGARGGDSAG